MKFEELFEEWEKDSNIDKTDLGDSAIKIPRLHHKYYKIFCKERSNLKMLEADMKKLKLEKYEFYTLGPTNDSRDKGWKLPPKGIILKQDLNIYMDADKDIIDLSLKIGVVQEKIDFLESIIKSLANRGYLIKTALDWQKFIMGE
jgi:hypothetical protein